MIYATSQASACKWHEAPVNSYLTGASPILFEVALATGAVLVARSARWRCSLIAVVFVGSDETRQWEARTDHEQRFTSSSCRSTARTSRAESFVALSETPLNLRS
jgi:hypothetical protein